ncbi:hypothetical protein [Leptospira congkakensis]|nr:hypothetical protein [Leptospira congkakensis]
MNRSVEGLLRELSFEVINVDTWKLLHFKNPMPSSLPSESGFL